MSLPIQTLSIAPSIQQNNSLKELPKAKDVSGQFATQLSEAQTATAQEKPIFSDDFSRQMAKEDAAMSGVSADKASPKDAPSQEEDSAAVAEAMAALASAAVPVAPIALPVAEEDVLQAVDAVDGEEQGIQALGMTTQDSLAGILEGSAQAEAPAADAQIDFQALIQEQGEASGRITDDPAGEAKAIDAMARMPEDVALAQQELEGWDVTIQPGSLENADEQIPPPSRVEVSQVAQPAEAAQSQADNTVMPRATPTVEEDASPSLTSMLAGETTPPAIEGAAFDAEAAAPVQPFEQIALEATLSQGVGRSQFVMRLKPESLGEVTVRLILQSDGVVARISVANENARTALAEQLYQLGDSMREKGVDVRAVELVQDYAGQSAMLHDGNQSSPGQGQAPRWKRGRSQSPAETIAAMEGYDNTLIAQITYVGEESQSVTIDA